MNKNSQFLIFLAGKAGKIVLTVVFAVIIWGILGALLQTSSNFILAITLIACGYFGWKSLNKITPDIFLIMPVVGWLFYFSIKGLLSIIIGAIIAPYWIGKTISNKIMECIENN